MLESSDKDLRVLRFQPIRTYVDFFKDIGIWQNFENQAQPLNSLVICNLNPKSGEIDSNCEFFAEDLEIDTLGFNSVSYTHLRAHET